MRKITGLIVAFLLLINICPVSFGGQDIVTAAEDRSAFAGYYPIRTANDLNNVRNNIGGKYYLANDIVFSDKDFMKGGQFYNNGSGWLPFESFTGIFEGNGYSIKNLRISSSSSEYVGLFKVNTGIVRNLGLDKINYNFTYEYKGTSNRVTFNHYTGGIAADNRGIIENCYNTGDMMVSVKHSYGIASINAGGIAGINSGRINKCYNESPVRVVIFRGSYGDNDITTGGIAGINTGTITNSYNTGSIGYDYNSIYTLITDHSGGGIAGYNKGIVRAVYNIGTVLENFNFVENTGGIIGYNYNNSSVSEAYYCNKSSKDGIGNSSNQKTVKKPAVQLTRKSTYGGFDFDNVWEIDSNKSYPYATLKKMKKVEIKNIEMKTNPIKSVYSKGEILDLTGGTINVIYEDNTKKEIELSSEMISGYDNQIIGKQNLTVTYNNKTTYFNVTVKNNAVPIITAEDFSIYIGEKFNVMSGVTAIDEEDGDITKKVQVIENNIDIDRVGVYSITYKVTDNNNNSATLERRVEVIAKPNNKEDEVLKPIIYAENVTLDLGQAFDPYQYAYAADSFDDIVECEVAKNNVNIYEVGKYEVEYRAMNSRGIEATKDIEVTVVDNGKPIIYAESRSIFVNETYNILEGVSAFDKKDGDITDKIKVIGSVNNNKPGEYEIIYSVTDSDNNVTEKEVLIVVKYAKEDINKDGVVNYEDLKFITEFYNVTVSDERVMWMDEYDVNNDGIIDICDYVILNEKIRGYVMGNIDLDFNKDGVVNAEDLQCIVDNYNEFSSSASFNWQYDLNVDGIVDICDYIIASEMINKAL